MSDFPYPGLRPFARDESDIFFGREVQVDRLLEKLDDSHFLAVVGPSGCGKSSLVRAGMIPALETGFMASAGARWQVAEMRPGNRPLSNLAEALLKVSPMRPKRSEMAHAAAFLNSTLRRGPLALAEILHETPLPEHTNLLVLVDQFEEIFRYRREGNRDEGDAFVALLLTTAAQKDVPIYIVITMRSDFLGRCTLFQGLPEAINDSQFLTPKLSREQLRDAIVGPARVFGSDVESALVNRLLNDMGPDPNQLPLMQHALSRMWNVACSDVPLTDQTDHKAKCSLTLVHYQKIGTLAEALSKHADKAYNELTDNQKKIAETIFKCLSEKGPDNLEIRRPTSLRDIAAVAEISETEVKEVIEVFRKPGRSFLTPPINVELKSELLIDISHESLIPNWKRLKSWVDKESESASTYRRLAETAVLHSKGKAGLWGEPDLQLALKWHKTHNPNKDWAIRYHPEFETAIGFLKKSKKDFDRRIAEKKRAEEEALNAKMMEQQQQIEEEHRRAEEQYRRAEEQARIARQFRRMTAALVIVFLVAGGIAIYALVQHQSVAELREQAKRYRREGKEFSEKAEQERQTAILSRKKAEKFQRVAQRQARIATSHRLASAAIDNLNVNPELGILLALQASSLTDSKGKILISETIEALHRSVQASRIRDNFAGHTDTAHCVAFSPDGMRLATASYDNTAKVWDSASGKELHTLKGHKEWVLGVAFSPDGKYIATASRDNTAKVWDCASYKEIRTINGHKNWVRSVSFSPDGTRLATASDDNTAMVWDSTSGEKLLTIEGHNNSVRSVAFSPDSKQLATASADATAKIWDTASGKELHTLETHAYTVFSVTFSPDSKQLATASHDATAKVWDTASGKELHTLKGHTNTVYSVAFSPDSKQLATASWDATAKVWNTASGKELHTLKGHTNQITSVVFSPDGTRLVTASADTTAKMWDITSGREPFILKSNNKAVYSIALNQDGTQLATGGRDKMARVWDIASEKELHTLIGHENTVFGVAFSPDGTRLATASADHTAKVWDTASGEELLTLKGHTDCVSGVSFSPDGKYIATASWDKTAKIWDSASDKVLLTLKGHTKSVNCVAFSPDSKKLATASSDTTVRVWNTASGKELRTLKEHINTVYSVAFSPDSKKLATASSDTTAKVWDTASGKELRTLKGHTTLVYSVAFSPDSKQLATASWDATAKVWNTASGEELLTLRANNSLHCVAFSPDNTRLAIACNDGVVGIYAVEVGYLKALARMSVTRSLTDEECQKYLDGECPPSVKALGLFVEGKQLARMGDMDAAVTKFRQAQEQDPNLEMNHVAEAKRLYVNTLLYRGRNLVRIGDIDGAATEFQRAREQNPNLELNHEAEAWHFAAQRMVDKGRQLAGENKIEEAIASCAEATGALEKALSLFPDNDIFLSSLNSLGGIYYDQLYEYEAAYEQFVKVLKLKPGTLAYRANFAEANLATERLKEAYNLARKLLTESAGSKKLAYQEFPMRFVMISSLVLQRRIDDANRELTEFIGRYNSVIGEDKLGWSYKGTKNFIKKSPMDEEQKETLLKLIEILEQSAQNKTIEQILGRTPQL